MQVHWEVRIPPAPHVARSRGDSGFRSWTSCPLPPPPPTRSRRVLRRTIDQGLRLGIFTGALRFKSLPYISYFLFSYCVKVLCFINISSEREGFEPSVPFRVHTTSNRTPSAARSSLQFALHCVRSRGDSPCSSFGAGGIRTPGTLASSMVFETISFNRSDTAPNNRQKHYTS